MADINWFHVFALVITAITGIYFVTVRNRFKIYEQNIRAASARIGATIQYVRSIDRHGDRQSGKAHRHVSQIANKGVRRGPRGKWRPAFFADFKPWPDARGIEVIIPAMEAGLGGRGHEYQAGLALIEAIRIYNQELDQIPGGTVAEHFWHFRHYSYRITGGPAGGRRGRRGPQSGGGRPRHRQPQHSRGYHRRAGRRGFR